jgi:hypothetical protein
MLPISYIVSYGYLKSSMMARSLAWSMGLNAFVESIYQIYIS